MARRVRRHGQIRCAGSCIAPSNPKRSERDDSGSDTSGLKPKGVIHWVDAATAVAVTIRLFDRLFSEAVPDLSDLDTAINPDSLVTRHGYVEKAIVESDFERFQFERQGYFCKDSALPGTFNRTVTLRDKWKP